LPSKYRNRCGLLWILEDILVTDQPGEKSRLLLRITLASFIYIGGTKMRKLLIFIIAAAILGLTGCGYNSFQSTDEQIKASWAEVLNQYQRRSDLVPNLVSTVKGETQFEQDTLIKVVEARSRATSIQATPELINDPAAFQKFQQAQGQLSGALSRLLVVSENYPNLKANQAFRDLQAQLEGHRKPHLRRPQPVHQISSGVQRDGEVIPIESDCNGVWIQRKSQFHGGEREGNFQATVRQL
jgi:hypothetical protein